MIRQISLVRSVLMVEREVTVSGGSYGWLMDQDATYDYLIDAI